MVDKINKPKDVQTPLVQTNGNKSAKEQSKESTFGFGFNAADLDIGVSVEKRDAIQDYTPKEKIEKQRNINIYDKKDRKGSTSQRYVGDRSLETVLAQNGIKISQNEETQKIYERLAALPQDVYDQLKPTDIEAILKGNKDLYSIASAFEYGFGVQILNRAEQKQVEDARKKEWGKDYKEKEVALQMLSNKYDNAIALLQNYKDNQGLLNTGFWRENASDILKELSNLVGFNADKRYFHYNLTDIIEHLQSAKQKYLPRLEQHVHSNNSEFAREFYNITGKPFNPTPVKLLEEAIANNNAEDVEKWSDKCFGNDLDKYIEKTLSRTQGIDGAGDIAVMLIGAEFMGKGVMSAFGKGFTKLAAVKGGKIMVPLLAGGTTLATWTGFQGSVNAVTKKAPTTTQDLKNVGIASLESFGFGAFGGLIQQTAIAPLMKAIDKPAKQAVQSVATKLELNGQMSMADVVKTTMKVSTQDPSFIAKTAGFVTEVGGFTVYEMVEEVAKDLCTDNGNLPENMTLEDVTKYVGEKFAGQLNNLGGIKFMSNMFMMLKGGRIGQQAVINATLENAKELNNIKVKPITVDGKKQFEITTPDNKKMVVETVDDIITTSQVMLQMQFIKNAKTEAQALPADGLKNRINQKINELDIRTQKIDQKYRDAAKSIKDKSASLGMYDIIDATPEELAKYVKEHTKKVLDHKGNENIFIEPDMYTTEQFYEKINHLRDMREFLNQQSTKKQITVHRLDSYSIMEQVEIKGQKLSAIMQDAVKNNNVEEVLAILNESNIDVNYKNFISTTTNPDFEWYGANIKWEVNVPKGSKGAQLKALVEEQIPSEKEFLLQAGSTFKIKSAEFKDGIWHIKADLVQKPKPETTPKVEVKPSGETVEYKDVEIQNKGVLEGGIKAQELEEVAPEARYLIENENMAAERIYIENLEANLKRKMQNAESPEEQRVIQDIVDKATVDNRELIDLLVNNKTISNDQALTILGSMTKVPDVMSFKNVAAILSQVVGVKQNFGVHDQLKQEYAIKLLKNNVPAELIPSILDNLYKANARLVDIELKSPNPDFKHMAAILQNTLWKSSGMNTDRVYVSRSDVKFTEFLMQETDVPRKYMADIGRLYTNEYLDKEFVKQLCTDSDFPQSDISTLLSHIVTKRNGKYYIPLERGPKFKIDLTKRMITDKNCPNELITDIIAAIDRQQLELFDKLYADTNIPKSELSAILWLDYAQRTGLNKLLINDKVNILVKSLSLDDKTLSHLQKYGFDKVTIKKMIDDIQLEMGTKDVNIQTSEINKKSLFKHFIANNTNVEKLIADLDLNQLKDGIPLKYSRSEFLTDVQNILKGLDKKEQTEILNYFGMQITDGKMEGIPIIPEGQGAFSEAQLSVVDKLKQKINDFTLNNETTIKDPALKELFDSVIQGCPEFTTIVGKVQHATHKYPVDIHTLKVLQEAFKNPEYERLDDESKTVLKFAILLHDLGKHEAVRDPGHYEASAKYAVSILNKYNLPDRVKSRIIETIYNHHWFEAYNKGEIGPEMVSAIFRTPKDLDLAIIMGKADLMGVSDDFHLRITKSGKPEKFEEFWQEKVDALRHYQDVRYGKANLVTDTKFNQTANRKFPTQKVVIDGKEQELQVLNLMDDSTSNDLYKYGFAPGTTKDNARFFAHFNDRLKGLKVFMALSSSPTTESVQSLSLISKANSRSYRQQIYGVITDVDIKNIAQASSENISSGYKKDLKHFSKDLFSIMRTNTFVRDCLIDELGKSSINLTTEEYAQLAEKLADIQYLTQITTPITVGNKTIPTDILQRALETSRDRLFDGDLHSEIVAINPRVKALVARVSSLEECSPEFLRLAKENNLPIILIGHNDKSGINANNKPRITGNEPTPTAKTEPETTPTIEAKPIQSDYKPYEPKLLDVQSKDAFVTFDKYNSVLKPEVEAELRNIATDIHNKAKLAEQEIVDMMERNGLTPDGYEIGHRAKSEQSLYDKLKNYLIENYEKKGNVTIQDAIKNVQDAVGVRTIIKAKDYTTDPQVQALLKAGKKRKAIALATQLQTAEMYKNLKTMMKALKADGVKDFGVVRISNYVSEKGVPYFSQRLLNRLKKIVDIGYADKNDPAYKQMLQDSGLEAPAKDYGVKKKDAGYTAFQANFKTKSGFVFEWQCRGKEINEFAEAEHIQYDVFSGKDVIKGDKHLERILRPTVDLMNPNTVPLETVKYLNSYKSKYYEYLREKELGFKDAEKPEFDSKNYDIQLCAENLIEMHNTIDKINKIKKDVTKTETQKEQEIEQTITNYESWLNNLKKEATMR